MKTYIVIKIQITANVKLKMPKDVWIGGKIRDINI